MPRIIRATLPCVVAFALAPLVLAVGQPSNSFAVARFNEQVASYMALRHDVENRVGVPYVSSNSSDIAAMQAALAHGIRKLRPKAQAGDIFNLEAGSEIRRRIQHVLKSQSVSEAGLLTDLQRDSPESLCTPSVNGTFDWRFGAMMPTVVIEALPDVPWPLQYRFVCRDLVLIDVDAGLIVDVLPDALAAP